MNKKLTPFYWCMLQSFPFIEATFDAIDNYGLLCKIVEYVNKTATKTNELGIKVEELNNWFNSLDLQDEVNKKLDEMAESGELQNIILNYLGLKSILYFDNIEEMKNAEYLSKGNIIKTLGFYNIDDGGSAYYYVTDSNLEVNNINVFQLKNNLKASLLVNNKLNIKQLGANGNGSTDYQDVIIQKAIDLIKENGGGEIIIPNGIYLLNYKDYIRNDNSVYGIYSIKLPSNISIIGEENAVLKVREQAFGIGTFYRVIGSEMNENSVSNVIIKNIIIDGSYDTHLEENVNENGILLEANSNILIENVKVLNCRGNGIYVNGRNENPASNITINNCYVNKMATIGIEVGRFSKGIITNNRVLNCNNNGIDIYGNNPNSASPITKDFIITDNIVENTLNGIFAETVENGKIENNLITGCGIGIHSNTMNNITNNVTTQNNNILNCDIGIVVTGEHIEDYYSGNVIRNYTNCAIHCESSSNTRFLENILVCNNSNIPIIKLSGNSNFNYIIHNKIVNFTNNNPYIENTSTINVNNMIELDNVMLDNIYRSVDRTSGQSFCEIPIPKNYSSWTGKLTVFIPSTNQLFILKCAFINGVLMNTQKENIWISEADEVNNITNYLNTNLLIWTNNATQIRYKWDIENL